MPLLAPYLHILPPCPWTYFVTCCGDTANVGRTNLWHGVSFSPSFSTILVSPYLLNSSSSILLPPRFINASIFSPSSKFLSTTYPLHHPQALLHPKLHPPFPKLGKKTDTYRSPLYALVSVPSRTFSRAWSAKCLRTRSRSSSACRRGIRWMRDHIFSRASSLLGVSGWCGKGWKGEGLLGKNVLLLADPLAHFVEAKGHDAAHGEEVVGGAEAAGGDVALSKGVSTL